MSMADIITGSRILLSLLLCFARTLSPGFMALYLSAGVTDMLDGFVARKTHTASAFGAKLDTVADICFLAVAACKLIPVLCLPVWLWCWTGVVAVIKAGNIVAGFALHGEFPAVHSVSNKAAGLLLFVFPVSVPFVNPTYGAVVVCVAATFAAIREGEYIRKKPPL